jgi:MFS family permease
MIVGGTDGTVSNALVGSQSFCKLMQGGYKNSSGKYAITATTNTIWSAVNTPFQVISVPLAGLVIDRVGRRFTMWIGLSILIVAGAAQLGAQNWKTFCLVKVLYGLAGGFTQVASITFVSEIAPRELRGLLMAIVPLMSMNQHTFTISRKTTLLTLHSNHRYYPCGVYHLLFE